MYDHSSNLGLKAPETLPHKQREKKRDTRIKHHVKLTWKPNLLTHANKVISKFKQIQTNKCINKLKTISRISHPTCVSWEDKNLFGRILIILGLLV